MDIPLTWNLAIVAGLMLIFGYNFILGQKDTVKLIICTYISIFAADGIASILKEYVLDPSGGVQSLVGDHEVEIFSWIRLVLFLLIIVIFVIKSGFHIHLGHHKHWLLRGVIHGIFSGICAVLLMTTVLVYLAGISVVEGLLYAQELNIYSSSSVARILIDYMSIWFTLPAVAFLVTSFVFEEALED